MAYLRTQHRFSVLVGTAARRTRAALNHLLAWISDALLPEASAGAPLSRHEVRTILVCRPNVKLGNTLLLTPLLTELNRLYPDAAIDLVSAYARTALLFKGQPGLRRVLFLTHKAIATPIDFFRQVAAIRREHYDLAIDPNPNSSTARLMLWACRSTYRLGFNGSNQWLRLSHAFPAPSQKMHESVRPLLLLRAIATDRSTVQTPKLGLHLDAAELAEGRKAVSQELAARNASSELVIGHLTGAAGAKALDREWWKAFWQQFRALEPRVTSIEFLSWKDQPRSDHEHVALSLDCPRKMAAAISSVDLFISADTGPMHLASATATPTIGLFVTTDPARYGPRKHSDLSPVVSSSDPAQVATLCVEHLRRLRCSPTSPLTCG